MESNISGLEQGRAKFAYECAKEGSLLDKKKEYKDKNYKSKEYKAYTKKIPMLIKTNGLGATFAFMFSKGGTYEFIGDQILDWLSHDQKGLLSKEIKEFKDLNEYVISRKSYEYRMITIEILSFFNWLRRFAEGLIVEDNDVRKS